MSRFLFASSPQSGHFNPATAIAHRLQLPRDIGSDRTKVGADRLISVGHGYRRWTAVPGVNARR